MRTLRSAILPLLLWACLTQPTHEAHAARWDIVPEHDGTEVVFRSKATMESFDGKTDQVRGWIELQPTSLADAASWHIEVDLASFDTGIGLRNKHMRENHLHTDEHPKAVFRGERLQAESSTLTAGKQVKAVAVGELTLHGVTEERDIPVTLELKPEGSLTITGAFSVSLAAHDIPRPKFLVVKLADTQKIELRLHAQPSEGTPP